MRVARLPVQLLKFRGTTCFRKMSKNRNRKNIPAVYRKYLEFVKNSGKRNVWAIFEGRLRGSTGPQFELKISQMVTKLHH